jgi:hypothetical protein
LDEIEKEIEQDPDLLFDAFDKDNNKLPVFGEMKDSHMETQTPEIKQEEQKIEPTRKTSLQADVQKKDGDKHRRNLLSKLTYEKIWLTPHQKPKFYETAIIFDWDDTLLCTSFINPSGVYQNVELGPTILQHIKVLETKVKQ